MQDPSLQEGATQQAIDRRLDGQEPARECPECGGDLDAPAFVERRKATKFSGYRRERGRRVFRRRNNAVIVPVARERRHTAWGRRMDNGRRRQRPD